VLRTEGWQIERLRQEGVDVAEIAEAMVERRTG
jgi:hypothetical protein